MSVHFIWMNKEQCHKLPVQHLVRKSGPYPCHLHIFSGQLTCHDFPKGNSRNCKVFSMLSLLEVAVRLFLSAFFMHILTFVDVGFPDDLPSRHSFNKLAALCSFESCPFEGIWLLNNILELSRF